MQCNPALSFFSYSSLVVKKFHTAFLTSVKSFMSSVLRNVLGNSSMWSTETLTVTTFKNWEISCLPCSLHSHLGKIYHSLFQNSIDFIEKVGKNIPKEHKLVSFDVTNLFTNVLSISQTILAEETFTYPLHFHVSLLQICMTTNVKGIQL